MMKENDSIQEFSLFGGPLRLLGSRLGLVRDKTNTIRLGLAIGLLTWGVLMALRLLQGSGYNVFSLTIIGIHVRFLVAIPLFFVCETWVAPKMTEFVRYIVQSGLVPESELPALALDIRRVGRLKDSWLVQAIFVLVIFIIPFIETSVQLTGSTGNWALILNQTEGRFAGFWYLGFCLPLFRYLLLCWLWHLGLWWYFLWRVKKRNLNLIPTHSDGAAGLGYLEVIHEQFIPLVLAYSAILSAAIAENIHAKMAVFETMYGMIAVAVILTALLFIGPLVMYSYKLFTCRSTGLNEYMAMASQYVQAFDHKWVRNKEDSGESQLGTSDLQSLADLSNSLNMVRQMRLIPASRRLLIELAVAVILPFVPLIFMKYSFSQVAGQLFQTLTGQ